MGWWKSGDDLLGDGPADLCDEGLEKMASSQGKPNWQQFLDALDAALARPFRLRAAFRDESPELRSDPGRASANLTAALSTIVLDIAAEYAEHREREPTLTEILGTFRFCLGPRPEKAIGSAGPTPKLRELYPERDEIT
jgi:hypothetical protein